MRYTVVEDAKYSGVGGYIARRFSVVENLGTREAQILAFMLTGAEAHIFLFGLQQIAEGRDLQASPLQEEFVGFRSSGEAEYEPIMYDGPTEGVAP
jgi:hypothetical protein